MTIQLLRFKQRLSAGLVGLERHTVNGKERQLWVKMTKVSGGAQPCARCGQFIPPGEEMWMPTTNGKNRADRLCGPCILEIEAEAPADEPEKG